MFLHSCLFWETSLFLAAQNRNKSFGMSLKMADWIHFQVMLEVRNNQKANWDVPTVHLHLLHIFYHILSCKYCYSIFYIYVSWFLQYLFLLILCCVFSMCIGLIHQISCMWKLSRFWFWFWSTCLRSCLPAVVVPVVELWTLCMYPPQLHDADALISLKYSNCFIVIGPAWSIERPWYSITIDHHGPVSSPVKYVDTWTFQPYVSWRCYSDIMGINVML